MIRFVHIILVAKPWVEPFLFAKTIHTYHTIEFYAPMDDMTHG